MGEEDKPGEMSLRFAEINKASAGRGLCSAGIHVARRLNVKAGEIVEISGEKTTACIFFPNSEDEGKQIIRADQLVRLNAGTGLGEIVTVRKARPEPANRVVVAPTNTKVQIQPRKMRDSLMNRPVVKGDNISLMNMTIPNDRPDIESDGNGLPFPFFGGRRKRSYTLGELRLVVLETTPEDGIVQITPATAVEIKGTIDLDQGIIGRIREAIRNVYDELQAFLGEHSRSSFESFLSSIGNKSKNQDPLLDAPHDTGIYFILLREEMDFLSGKPFYIGYAKNLNDQMHDLFPDENGKYQHELSARMLEDVLKRSTPPGG